MEFCELTSKEFDEFSSTYKYANFWQTSQASSFREKGGWQSFYVGVKENNELIAAVTLTSMKIRFGYAFEASRGLCVDYTNLELLDFFVENIKQYCANKDGLYFRMDPYFPLIQRDKDGEIVEGGYDHHYIVDHLIDKGFIHFGYTRGDDVDFEPRWQFCLDLKGKSEQDILNEMDQKMRNQINATSRKGIEVREIDVDEMDKFEKIMQHTAKRRAFEERGETFYTNQKLAYGDMFQVKVAECNSDKYIANMEKAKQALLDEQAKCEAILKENPNNRKSSKRIKALVNDLKTAEEGVEKAKKLKLEYGERVLMAASFFVVYGNEVVYLYSGAYDKFLSFNPSVALQWNMISYAISHHFNRYNFYGISGNFKPDEEGYGVYHFKRGFNGYVEELLGVFELPLNKSKYKLYKGLKKALKR